MAKLIAEIGADTSEYRSSIEALTAANQKAFGKMAKDSEPVDESLRSLKRGVNDLKDVFLAGGAIEAVKKFFDLAIESANKSTDANDQNAAAVRRFADTFSEAKEGAGNFAKEVVGTFNRVGEGIATNLKGTWAIITGTWDKWREGEGALEASEKGLRQVTLALAEAKKHAEEYNKLNQEAQQLAEQRAEAERKMLPIFEQKAMLEKAMLDAQRAEADAGEDHLARRKAQVDQLRIGNQLLEVQKGIETETAKQMETRAKQAEAERKVMLESLTLDERRAVISDEIAALQKAINSGALNATETEKLRNQLADRQVEIKDVENKLTEETKKLDEERNKLAEKQLDAAVEQMTAQQRYLVLKEHERELVEQIAKMPDGAEKIAAQNVLLDTQNKLRSAARDVARDDSDIAALLLKGREFLTTQEEMRYKLLTGQVTQAQADLELHQLTAKLVAGVIAPAEKERLAALVGQGDAMDGLVTDTKQLGEMSSAQLEDQIKLLDLARARANEEGRSTDEIDKQVQLVQQLISAKTQANKISITRTGEDYINQSTSALQGVLDRLNAQLYAPAAPGHVSPAMADVANNYGDWLVGSTLRSEITAVQAELNRRNEVINFAKMHGEAATRYTYGDDLAQRAMQELQNTSAITAQAVVGISQQLSTSALFGGRQSSSLKQTTAGGKSVLTDGAGNYWDSSGRSVTATGVYY